MGLHANYLRGSDDLTMFGPDRVLEFLRVNNLKLIVRAHQCVNAGYEFFAGQRLITVFSAANYAKQHENKGACLDVSRDLCIWFRVIDATHKGIAADFGD